MTQKTALILSAILTAFVLVVGGGVIARVSQTDVAAAQVAVPEPTATAPAQASAPVDQAAAVMAQAQALLQQRDAEYRQLIEQANQRLTAMNQQQAVAQAALVAQKAQTARVAAPKPVVAQAAAAVPQIAISAESALYTAIAATNNATMIRAPELVRFEGQVAYEIGFTRGVVYVDANTGAVLYNGTQGHGGGKVTQPAQPPTQPPASGGEHEDDHGHED